MECPAPRGVIAMDSLLILTLNRMVSKQMRKDLLDLAEVGGEIGIGMVKAAIGYYGPGLLRQLSIDAAAAGYHAFEAWAMQDD